nr:MAG TPA: hypothetical protein [Caudoviricetes sp.]
MYDYLENVTADVRDYVEQEVDLSKWAGNRDGLEEKLNGDLWTCDSVTGNGSGSYTFNRVQAQIYVLDGMDELQEAVNEFGIDSETIGEKFLESDWEYFDVTIRCYLLGQAIAAVLDDLEEDGAFEEEEEEEED